jgi:hypothetical protein
LYRDNITLYIKSIYNVFPEKGEIVHRMQGLCLGGTENVTGIVGLGAAARPASVELAEIAQKVRTLWVPKWAFQEGRR